MIKLLLCVASASLLTLALSSLVRTVHASPPFSECGTPTASTYQAETSDDCGGAPSHCATCSWSLWSHYWRITWADNTHTDITATAHGDCTPPPTIFSSLGKCQPTF